MSDQASHINTSVLQVRPTVAFPPDNSSPICYFFCPSPNAKMHRTDGMTVDFRAGIHATNNKYTIDYLTQEIAYGHPELRFATQEQIESFNYHKDPVGFTRAKTIAEMEAQIDARVLLLLNAKLKEKGIEEEFTEEDLKEAAGNAVNNEKLPGAEISALDKLQAQLTKGASGAVSTADLPHSA
jgi:hypothetical protein